MKLHNEVKCITEKKYNVKSKNVHFYNPKIEKRKKVCVEQSERLAKRKSVSIIGQFKLSYKKKILIIIFKFNLFFKSKFIKLIILT
jgi:hypothetical protein